MGNFERPKRPDPAPVRAAQPARRSAPEPIEQRTSHASFGLRIDPPWLRLPVTEIGKAATATVVVTNPDARPRTLDPVAPLAVDPFGDLAIPQATSDRLAPDESRALDVEFRPSREGVVEQRFRISTDRGFGPTAELRVSAAGLDVTSTQDRVTAQDRERVETDARRSRDPLHAPRVHAEAAVRDWAARAIALDASYAEWVHNNWIHFLGRTGGDVHFSPPSLAHVIGTKLLAKATAKLAAPEVEGSPFASKVIEKAVEKLAEYVWDELGGAPDAYSPEQAGVDAATWIARQGVAKGTELARYRERADLVIRDTESTAMLRIAHTTSEAELATWQAWTRAQISQLSARPGAEDFSLSDELLASWVLQRAATPTTAGHNTNGTAWQTARAELAKTGKLPSVERNDLFIHQCRYEWSQLAIDPGEIEAAIADLEARRARIEEEARVSGMSPEAISAQIAGILGDTVSSQLAAWFHRSRDWVRTASLLATQAGWLDPGSEGGTYLNRRFDLTCLLDLESSGTAVAVKTYQYRLTSPDGTHGTGVPVERVP
jgi:hypothetical protein